MYTMGHLFIFAPNVVPMAVHPCQFWTFVNSSGMSAKGCYGMLYHSICARLHWVRSAEGTRRLLRAMPWLTRSSGVTRSAVEKEKEGAMATPAPLAGGPGRALSRRHAAGGLIDEYRARVYPVLVGGGIPFFPQRERRVDLELVETRTFSSRVVYLRYRVAR
jgi:hypothetical protein